MSIAVLIEVALHTVLIYVFLIVAVRLIGRRVLSQLSPIDLMVLLLLGSAVETAMVTANTAIKAGFVSASVLLAANYLLTQLMLRSKRFRHLANGGPILLIHNGIVLTEHLCRSGLTLADVKQAMRAREIGAIEDVKFAVLEPDGRINFVKKGSKVMTGTTSLQTAPSSSGLPT